MPPPAATFSLFVIGVAPTLEPDGGEAKRGKPDGPSWISAPTARMLPVPCTAITPNLGLMPAQAVEQLGAPGDQHLARFMLHQDGLRNAFSGCSKWRIKSYSSAAHKRKASADHVYC